MPLNTPQCTRQPSPTSQQRTIQDKMSIVSMLRNYTLQELIKHESEDCVGSEEMHLAREGYSFRKVCLVEKRDREENFRSKQDIENV